MGTSVRNCSRLMRFRRALDRGNVTEARSAASELQFVALAEALGLTLLLAENAPGSTNGQPFAGIFASRRMFRTSTCARAWPCSPSSPRSRRIDSPLAPSLSSSASVDHVSASPMLLCAGRGRSSYSARARLVAVPTSELRRWLVKILLKMMHLD